MSNILLPNRIRISTNFFLDEFIDPITYSTYGASSRWFIDKEIVELAQFYRNYFKKPVVINNWANGGQYKESGHRRPESETGAELSQHKRGSAFDCRIVGMHPDEVRTEILKNEKTFMEAGLTTLEHGDYAPTWVHSDRRWTNMDKILIVRPTSVAIMGDSEAWNPSQSEYFIFENGELIPTPFCL